MSLYELDITGPRKDNSIPTYNQGEFYIQLKLLYKTLQPRSVCHRSRCDAMFLFLARAMCFLMCVCVCLCVLAVYNKAQAQRISNREFKLWTFLQGTESRVATFLDETCVMSHQSLSRQAKLKYESPTAVEFGSKTPRSDHGSNENV